MLKLPRQRLSRTVSWELQYPKHIVLKAGKSQKMQEEKLTSIEQKRKHFLLRSVASKSNFILFFIRIPSFLPSSIFFKFSDYEPRIIRLATRCIY